MNAKNERLGSRIPTWRIFRRIGGKSFFIGIVEAAEEFLAIRKAMTEFGLPDDDRRRISAERRE
jgi:hypothetical protein